MLNSRSPRVHHNRSRSSSLTRRQAFGFGAAAASVPLLASCAGGGSGGEATVYDQPSGDVPAEYADRQRVVMWSNFTSRNGSVLQKNIDAFNESQEDIFCEVQIFEGYDNVASKLTASLQAQQAPDISILSDVDWNRFYLNDALEPLTGYFDDSFGPDAFSERFITEGTVKDDIWWLPFGRSTPLFYYNRDLFAEVGLPDRAPETYDEYREWGQELNSFSGGGDVTMRAYPGGDDWYFQGSSWAFGGGYSDGMDMQFTTDATVAALEFDRAFIFDDKSGYLSTDHAADFVAGTAATILNSTGALTSVVEAAEFEVGCGFLPEQETVGVPTGGGGVSIFRYASEERKQAAMGGVRSSSLPVRHRSTGRSAPAICPPRRPLSNPRRSPSAPRTTRTSRSPSISWNAPRVPTSYVVTSRSAHPRRKDAIQAVYSGGADPLAALETMQSNLEAGIEKIRDQYEERVGS